MSRSLKKGPFVAYHLLKKINKMNTEGKKRSNYNLVTQFNYPT